MKRFTRREEISPAPSRPDVMEEAEFSGSMVPDEGIEPPTFGLQNPLRVDSAGNSGVPRFLAARK
jgi:hypothetical protein